MTHFTTLSFAERIPEGLVIERMLMIPRVKLLFRRKKFYNYIYSLLMVNIILNLSLVSTVIYEFLD